MKRNKLFATLRSGSGRHQPPLKFMFILGCADILLVCALFLYNSGGAEVGIRSWLISPPSSPKNCSPLAPRDA